MNPTLLRVLSAAVALPGALYLMFLGGWPFVLLVLVAGTVCFAEFMAMVHKGDRPAQLALTLLGTAYLLLAVTGQLARPGGFLGAFTLTLFVVLAFLFRPGEIDTVAARAGLSVLGFFWVGGLLFAALLGLMPEHLAWVLLACVLSWGSDTGAYFAGRWFGRRKLYERVSPKKTWEGAIGGVLLATLGALVLRHLLGPAMPLWHFLILTPIAAALGQVGDLAESLLKRSMGVKDSGWIMPGHGGLFDRVDALIFVVVVLYAYAAWVLELTPRYLSLPAFGLNA